MVDAVRPVDGVTFNDLYEEYPDLNIDVAREQDLLAENDVVVLQHPFYWYSTPAILKEWQDLVLEHGWAYGQGGNALQGKTLLNAVSTGGTEEAYCERGSNRFSMRQLLAPIEQTALLCRMEYLPPFVVHGTHGLSEIEIGSHADDYRLLVEGLRDGRVELAQTAALSRLNSDVARLLGG